MTRALYASLIRLHPAAFRRQFGAEMMWIFDQARMSEGDFTLLGDLLISVARQWLLRSGAWKALLALMGAAVQVGAGGGGWWLFNGSGKIRAPDAALTPDMNNVVLLALCTVGTIVVMVAGAAFWVGQFNRRRGAAGRRTV